MRLNGCTEKLGRNFGKFTSPKVDCDKAFCAIREQNVKMRYSRVQQYNGMDRKNVGNVTESLNQKNVEGGLMKIQEEKKLKPKNYSEDSATSRLIMELNLSKHKASNTGLYRQTNLPYG